MQTLNVKQESSKVLKSKVLLDEWFNPISEKYVKLRPLGLNWFVQATGIVKVASERDTISGKAHSALQEMIGKQDIKLKMHPMRYTKRFAVHFVFHNLVISY